MEHSTMKSRTRSIGLDHKERKKESKKTLEPNTYLNSRNWVMLWSMMLVASMYLSTKWQIFWMRLRASSSKRNTFHSPFAAEERRDVTSLPGEKIRITPSKLEGDFHSDGKQERWHLKETLWPPNYYCPRGWQAFPKKVRILLPPESQLRSRLVDAWWWWPWWGLNELKKDHNESKTKIYSR